MSAVVLRSGAHEAARSQSVILALLPIMAVVLSGFLVTGLAMPVLPLHVHEGLHLGEFVVGIVAGAQFAAALITRFWAGTFADRRGAKQAVVAGLLLAAGAGILYLLSLRFRVSQPHKELTHYTQPSCVCLVVQGAKSATVGEETYDYAAGKIAVFSVDVPMSGRVTRASASEPYFNFKIDLDAAKIAELATRVFPHGVPQASEKGAIYLVDADDELIDAAVRFLELMRRPADAELLAPLVLDEILIRLLRGPAGSRIAQIGRTDSNLERIAKAVTWLRQHYDETADIEHLASLVNMSVTSFHRQFKALTSMSPLQYQKALRLQEARRLMLTSALDAGAAGRRVGYMSASQFTREYGRFFGSAPTRDINRLRAEGITRDEALA